MGMYDVVKVKHLLPDGHIPEMGEEYQTKDTDEQGLCDYLLTEDGRLLLGGKDVCFHGSIRFYTSNVSGSSAVGVITRDNKPPVRREYVALFKNGQLIDIQGGITKSYEDVKHYTNREEWWADHDAMFPRKDDPQ